MAHASFWGFLALFLVLIGASLFGGRAVIGDFLDDHLNDENGFVGRRRDNGKLRVLVVVVLTRVNLVAIELLAFKIAFCRPLSSLVLGIRQVHLTKKKNLSSQCPKCIHGSSHERHYYKLYRGLLREKKMLHQLLLVVDELGLVVSELRFRRRECCTEKLK